MHLKNKRVFIVEDNLQNQAIAQLLLQQEGAEVAFERWGQSTVERLREFAPVDIILLDLMYPKNITGYDIFDAIRQEPEFDDVPIVAVSASDPAEAIPKTRKQGFAGFIAKPISYLFFGKQVADILNGANLWLSRAE